MKIIKGDLLRLAKAGRFDVIVHGCNCFCTMGAGIAKSIRAEFPEAFLADLSTQKGDINKLGTYSDAIVRRGNVSITIINAYTQYEYNSKKANVSYDAIRSVFRKIKEKYHGKAIGYPAIGAGLGGGQWEVIYRIICEELKGEDHCFVEYDGN